MSLDPLDSPATSDRLYLLARKNCLSANALDYALKFINVIPDKKGWQRFFDKALLSLGTAFFLAGVIFFFAYNWAEMHRFAKFGVLEGGILILAVFATWHSLNHLVGKMALLASAVLLGASYQTGADAFSLFLAWAILITPWVILGNFTPLWLLLILLLNLSLSLMLFWVQVIGHSDRQLHLLMFGLNGIFLVAWEIAFKEKINWLQNLWVGRLLFCVVLSVLIIPTIEAIISSYLDWSVIFYGITTLAALGYYYYTLQRRDLSLLTINSLGIVITLTTFVARLVITGEVDIIEIWLMLAVFVVLQVSVMTHLLLKLSKHWGKQE